MSTEYPEWYIVFCSARALGVPLWEYANLPETRGCIVWREWALASQLAEANAHKVLVNRTTRTR